MSRILAVDDEPAICWGLSRLGESLGHDVQVASSAEQGLAVAESWRPDLLVIDVRLPGVDGLSAMAQFRELIGAAPIIVITAFGDLRTAVRAVELGAFEYVLKPFDLQEIRAAIRRALDIAHPQATAAEVGPADGMLGRSPAMQAVFKRIALAAASDAAVMLSGESGVGKELAARAIHRHSPRREGPFVAVNIAALNPTLAEAELFGHVAGAFTGAVQARNGLLVEADGGALFIDEVADIPPPMQVKLLRALDSGEVLPVGADRPVASSFRVISATHRKLRRLVERGEFRHDLFYRLCTFDIALPPLRERPDDRPLLANAFAAQLAEQPVVLAEETLAELVARPWYGNVRELRKAVEHALVLARSGLVLPAHLPPPLPNFAAAHRAEDDCGGAVTDAVAVLAESLLQDPASRGAVYDRFLETVERPLLVSALSQSNQQCAPAARVLGLHRTTLKRKLDQYGISSRNDDQ
ncbi:MAG: sigma-54-dependent Fis family transcriptional regulator [Pirellulales bacterium]|nr:sigma-54-dependent Fis family transcriptional regulator [Pirellulales bacterium]